MKMKKGICCLLLLTMLVQLLPGMQLFAIDTRAAADYVTDGLVSLFDGKNHGSADNIWEDLCGENDITDLMANSSTGVGFTEEGWHSVNSKHAMPGSPAGRFEGKGIHL